MIDIDQAKVKYRYQKYTALQRGITWELTFDQWVDWWQNTGHWHERGHGPDKYVMSRYNDVGPYSLDNIFCQTLAENSRESAVRGRGKPKPQGFGEKVSMIQRGKSKPHQQGNKNIFHKDNLTNDLKQKIKQAREKTKKPVVTPFGKFPSVTEAAQALKVDKGTIGYRIKRHPELYYYEKTKIQ